MPSSPAMRFSPGREPSRAGTHKRGRSLEGLIPFREKDDDLALFNEVQTKEKGNFLLQSNDDFDDLFSNKLKYFSDHKLGISIPSRGESSNLLSAEGEKNDYDWLLTPPDTPLFTSLDDETPPVNLPIRGRPRSQPISISRSSTMERSHQSSRGSASPNRMSPSPRSSTSQSRGRPSSLPGTSPPPSLRNATPTRRSSPPSSKPSTPAPRSSTPSPVRTSTGSTEATVRGNSPAKSGRRNSASPKIKAWQANIPGFSSEVPPNLRTSLGDHHRASYYVRGSSPAASRNGSKSGNRQSMSPTPSRSVSSWHSHEGDNNNIPNSNIKGSVASSGDDDIDSLLSIPVDSFDHTAPKSLHASASSNYRNFNSSKKPTKVAASSSAPKRSIDMTIRQMDHHRKSPHNMFRPLLSSVPSSNAYGSNKSGGATHHHRTLASRNSSVTTSSNTSSDMGLSEPNQADLAIEHVKLAFPDMQEEVFSLEYDQIREGMPMPMPHNPFNEMDTELIVDETRKRSGMETEIEVSVEKGGIFPDNTTEALCSECGSTFRATDVIEGEPNLCEVCKGSGTDFVIITDVAEKPVDDVDSPDLSEKSVDRRLQIPETVAGECEISCSKDEVSYGESHELSMNEGEQILTKQHMISSYTNPKLDISEGVGIPLLLRSSSGGKGSIVRGRHFAAATSITIDDFSYMRDSVTSTRSSFGHGGGASASSSIDLGSSKQSESSVLGRFSSSRKSDNENYKSELFVKHQHSVSSLSVASDNAGKEIVGPTTCVVEQQQELALLSGDAHEEGDSIEIESNANWRTASDLSNSSMNTHLADPSVTPVSNLLDPDLQDVINQDAPSSSSTHPENRHQEVDHVAEAEAPNLTSLVVISEIEIEEDDDVASPDSVSDPGSRKSKSSIDDDLQEPSADASCNDGVTASDENSVPQNHAQSTLGESTNHGRRRTFTLEDATDAILFCRSIIHNLAYEAADIAIGKEDTSAPPVLEVLQPVIIRKSSPNRTDSRLTRRSSKSKKPKQKKDHLHQTYSDSKHHPTVVITDDDQVSVSSTRIVGPNKNDTVKPPPKLESKCNCVIM